MTEPVLDELRATATGPATVSTTGAARVTPYACYALLILTFANFINYADRSILSIIGHSIQLDLKLSDAQLGFLMGTAFAVFYGVMGIAMGRIADSLSRTRLMAAGLVVWSGMTALGSLAAGFAGLAGARVGVGVGEVTANPCSHSLLSDYFPARNRSAVLGIYVLGTYLGGAASLIGGGLILQHWGTLCASFPAGACHLANWRAALLVAGAPGLLLAVFVLALREPLRFHPVKKVGTGHLIVTEVSAAMPPFTLINLFQIGGATAVLRNILFAGALTLVATVLSVILGDWPQWAAVALGVYTVTTWGGVMRRRDPPLFSLTFGCPTFVLAMLGSGFLACFAGAVGAWSPTYAMRVLGASPGSVGVSIGIASAIASGSAVVLGGFMADVWKRRDPRAPMWICLLALFVPIPLLWFMLQAHDLKAFVPAFAAFVFLSMTWAGGIAALIQDLVLQRMRGTAAAAFALVSILIAAGIGPYWVGKVSTMTGSLTTGLYSLLLMVPIAAFFLFSAARRVPAETVESRRARAAAAGEPVQ
jgi:MFS family permease